MQLFYQKGHGFLSLTHRYAQLPHVATMSTVLSLQFPRNNELNQVQNLHFYQKYFSLSNQFQKSRFKY